MSAAFRYSSQDVAIVVAGFLMDGYADGSFVTVARNEASFTRKTGASGETTRNRNANNSGKITLKLMASSPSNAVLSNLIALDEVADGAGAFSVSVRDGSGLSSHSSARAWIEKPADADYDKEVGTREWVIECADLNTFNGGNFTL